MGVEGAAHKSRLMELEGVCDDIQIDRQKASIFGRC
jgi:hypothetical protein